MSQVKSGRQKVAEVTSIVAMILLLTYIADAAVGQGKIGFLPMTEAQRGMTFGTSSIVLFAIAIATGFRLKSKITTILLIAGGAIMGTSVLGASAMGEGGLATISTTFAGVIVIGYIILGFGIARAIRKC
jgi:hypothetical protein